MSWEEFQATKLGAAQTCSATLAGNHLMRDANALPETVSANQAHFLSPQKIHI
jgi:cathepsin H